MEFHKKDTHMVLQSLQVVFVGMDNDIEQGRQSGMRRRRGKRKMNEGADRDHRGQRSSAERKSQRGKK